METALSIFTILICSYLIGGINPAYIISSLHGFDIRKTGTGNAGASNAVLSFGKRAGVFVALADITKAFLLVRLAALAFPAVAVSKEIAGAACIIGHIFPLQMRFKGGKGLSCLAGVVLAFSPLCFILMLTAEMILAVIVKYFSIIPITAAAAFPVIYIIFGGNPTGFAMYAVTASVMELKHIENIRRIRSGTEFRISYLWNKEQEQLRVQKNIENRSVPREIDEHSVRG